MFWRTIDEITVPVDCTDIVASDRLIDLTDEFGVRGGMVEQLKIASDEEDSAVVFEFSGGRRLAIRNVQDVPRLMHNQLMLWIGARRLESFY